MIYLWDTDIYSAWERASQALAPRLARLRDGDEIVLSAVTMYEVLRGRTAAVAQAREESAYARRLAALVASLVTLRRWSVVPDTAETAARMAGLRRGRGNRRRADLCIAATALTAGVTLVTRNERDFTDLPGLRVENWVDEQA